MKKSIFSNVIQAAGVGWLGVTVINFFVLVYHVTAFKGSNYSYAFRRGLFFFNDEAVGLSFSSLFTYVIMMVIALVYFFSFKYTKENKRHTK